MYLNQKHSQRRENMRQLMKELILQMILDERQLPCSKPQLESSKYYRLSQDTYDLTKKRQRQRQLQCIAMTTSTTH